MAAGPCFIPHKPVKFAAWKLTPPKGSAAPLALLVFASPSGNLSCDVGDEDEVYCTSFSPPHEVSLHSDGTISIRSAAVPGLTHAASGVPILGYGQQDVRGPYRCLSAKVGVTCTVDEGPHKGTGFLINTAGVTRIGP